MPAPLPACRRRAIRDADASKHLRRMPVYRFGAPVIKTMATRPCAHCDPRPGLTHELLRLQRQSAVRRRRADRRPGARFDTPFYVYSARTLRRHFRVFDEAFAGTDHLICYAMKALSNLSILKLFAVDGRGLRHRVGRRADAMPSGRRRPAQDRFFRRRQDRRGDRGRARSRHPDDQRRVAPRTASRRRGRGPHEASRAGQPARQSRSRPGHASAHFHRPSRQQVRRTALAGRRILRRSERARRSSKSSGSARISDRR